MPTLATNYRPPEYQNSIASRDLFVTQCKEGALTAEPTEMEDRNQQTLCNSIRHTADRSSACDELELETRRNVDAPDGRMDRPSNEAQEEEALERRIERLGRERPKQFKSLWAEVAFIFSIAMSQVLSESTSV